MGEERGDDALFAKVYEDLEYTGDVSFGQADRSGGVAALEVIEARCKAAERVVEAARHWYEIEGPGYEARGQAFEAHEYAIVKALLDLNRGGHDG
jgi:hypothetical protein